MNRQCGVDRRAGKRARRSNSLIKYMAAGVVLLAMGLCSCGDSGSGKVEAAQQTVTVGVTNVVKKSLNRQITLSPELVPFRRLMSMPMESGYVKKLDSSTTA